VALRGYQQLRVKAIVEETHDARTLVLDVPDELSDAFAYKPGQYCTFRRRDDDGEVVRCYSMSTAPETDPDLAITVKRVVDGRMSNWLHDAVSVGDTLDVLAPAGMFVPQDRATPVIAFCGGSGVTPVFSIVKHLVATGERSIRVLYANRDTDSIIFRDGFDALAAENDQLRLRHHLDAEDGFLDAAAITEFVGSETDADVYVCGPTPFMDLVEVGLADAGVATDQIFLERFVNEAPADRTADAPPSGGDPEAAVSISIIMRGKRHDATYVAGDTVLDAARRASLDPPFSCQLGDCASCMALVKEGSATMRVNNALEPFEVDEGWVLTCQAVPDGDLVVEYEDL